MSESESQSRQDGSGNGPAETSRVRAAREHFEQIDQYVASVQDRADATRHHWYGQLFRNYWHDDADGMATFIAFNAMFAFMPVVLTLAIGLAVFLNTVSSSEEIENDDFYVNLPSPVGEPVQQIMDQSSGGLLGVGIVSIVVLFWGGARLYNSLDRAFTRIYRTPRRGYVRRKLIGVLFVPVVALLLVITALVVPLILLLVLVPLGDIFDVVPSVGDYLTAGLLLYAAGFILMISAYTAIPVHSPGFRLAWPGAAVAAFLFMLLTFIFPLYRQFFGSYSLYGAVFGFILTMMFWFYLAAQIVIIGAEINAYHEGRR